MTRALRALLFSLTLSIASVLPIMAEDAAPKASDNGGGGSAGAVSFGKRLLAFTVCFVVGTPIAIVRKTGDETVSGIKDLIGESRNPLLLVPSGILSSVPAMISGLFQGPVYAAKNSWTHSSDQPFGKDSFSLGEMD